MKSLSVLILAAATAACAQQPRHYAPVQRVIIVPQYSQPQQTDHTAAKYTAPGQAYVDYMHQRADTIRLLNNIQFSNSLKSKR